MYNTSRSFHIPLQSGGGWGIGTKEKSLSKAKEIAEELSCNPSTREKWSGWQELNLRGNVPKTCGWPLPYTQTWVARHGIE